MRLSEFIRSIAALGLIVSLSNSPLAAQGYDTEFENESERSVEQSLDEEDFEQSQYNPGYDSQLEQNIEQTVRVSRPQGSRFMSQPNR